MTPDIQSQLLEHTEALRLQLWVFSGIVAVCGLLLSWALKSMYDDQKKTLERYGDLLSSHDKDLAVLKDKHSIAEAITEGMQQVSDAIVEKNEHLRNLRGRYQQ